MPKPDAEITQLLFAWRSGDSNALDRLMPLVYEQLRLLAKRYMQSERPDHTLRATALVHEACIKLLTDKTRFEDRKHFLAIVAITMRRVLVEHARSHLRVKRGSGAQRLTLGDVALASKPVSIDVLDMDVALSRLSQQDPRKARLIELTYFGGLSGEESAEVLEVSTATVNRDLKLARAWLHHELTRQNQDHGQAGIG